MRVGDNTGVAMLTKLFLAFSIGLLGAGGIATQSALDIQRTAFTPPADNIAGAALALAVR